MNRNLYKQTAIKKLKYGRDNRYGHVVHTMSTGAMQVTTCVKCEDNGETAKSIFDSIVTNFIRGHNTSDIPNITSIVLVYVNGYAFKDVITKMMDCGSRIYSTLKHYPWAPIIYDQQVCVNDKHTMMQLAGTLLIIPRDDVDHNLILYEIKSRVVINTLQHECEKVF